jgi:phosphoribosylanthranilate isomerase
MAHIRLMRKKMFVKVCGLRTKEQIDKAIEYGYDAIGIVTYNKSKRYIPPAEAKELALYAKGKIDTFIVGLCYNDVVGVASEFDFVQIYETRPMANLVLAAKDIPPAGLEYRYFVYDASVGSGIFGPFPDWLHGLSAKLIVAGGLNKDNVCAVIKDLRPFGVDVSSGVEKEGVKNFFLMKEFIDAVRSCE